MAPLLLRRRTCGIVLTVGLSCLALLTPVQAARPLLDQHQWDRAFALFARDSNLPWRTTTVRLETYSSAPVEFCAYAVDPADVIVANHPQGRVLDTRTRKPIKQWRFSPPAGYRVEGNTVAVPLGAREGVFVIQARRNAAIQQVWINRTRIGLLSKEAPEGLLVYGTDLGTGHPLAHMRLLFLVGKHLEVRLTDTSGVVRWNTAARPRFVLAEWGDSRAFLSFLPQAPIPYAIVGVRLDRAVVRAGEELAVVGFARRHHGTHYVSSSGLAQVRLLSHGRVLASSSTPLDSAGAFSARLVVPNLAAHGAATVLVTADGASAGAPLAIDAAEEVNLAVTPLCQSHCRANAVVPLLISAQRLALPAANVPLTIRVVRSPHIFPPGSDPTTQEHWGATTVLASHLVTNTNGRLRVLVPAAADGLPSTLGIEVTAAGSLSSASTRLVLPNSAVALEVRPEHARIDVGESVGVGLRAFGVEDGRPIAGVVHIMLSHGPNRDEQDVTLDAHGRARAFFRKPQFGENLITANVSSAAGSASDANSVAVVPRALAGDVPHGTTLTVKTNQARYHPGAEVSLTTPANGAKGSAFLSIDDRRLGVSHVVALNAGSAHAKIPLGDPQGAVQASVSFVRDGALLSGSTPLVIDGPGHERLLDLRLDAPTYGQGQTARVTVNDGTANRSTTTVVRVSDAAPSGSADFGNVGAILEIGGATTQISASDDPPWHAWVSPQHSRALDLFADLARHTIVDEPPQLSDTASRVLLWRVERAGQLLTIPVPHTPGHYILSVLRVYNDGDVGAATTVLVVV